MKKTLRVIQPFFTAETGDVFTLDEKDNLYSSETEQEFHKGGENSELTSCYKSNFKISSKYAQELINEGYLEEVTEDQDKTKAFVNIFDEINNLKCKYNNELNSIEDDYKNAPACLKVEKETVLKNIIGVLNHLSSLKK